MSWVEGGCMRQGARVGPRNLSRWVLTILRDSTSYGTCRMHMSIIQTLGMDNPDTLPEAQLFTYTENEVNAPSNGPAKIILESR
jgi:hypothetical protein